MATPALEPLFRFNRALWTAMEEGFGGEEMTGNRALRAETAYGIVTFFLPLFLVFGGATCFLAVLTRTYDFFARNLNSYEKVRQGRVPPVNPRRHVLRTSLNEPPSPEALLALWNRRKDSLESAVSFGSALNDLEARVNNRSIRTAGGLYRGRNPGIKGWLRDHCPEIHRHYQTALQLKRLAQRLRDASEIVQPCPTEWLLPHSTMPLHLAAKTVQKNIPCCFRLRYAPPERVLAKRLFTACRPGVVYDRVPVDFEKSRRLVADLLATWAPSPGRLYKHLQFLLGYAGSDVVPRHA